MPSTSNLLAERRRHAFNILGGRSKSEARVPNAWTDGIGIRNADTCSSLSLAFRLDMME